MTPTDTLLGAARIIRQRGLHQGILADASRPADGPVGLVEAIKLAGGYVFDSVRWFERTVRAPAGQWSDEPGRTTEQAATALETAALEAALFTARRAMTTKGRTQ